MWCSKISSADTLFAVDFRFLRRNDVFLSVLSIDTARGDVVGDDVGGAVRFGLFFRDLIGCDVPSLVVLLIRPPSELEVDANSLGVIGVGGAFGVLSVF